MLNEKIRISDLQVLLDKEFGKDAWVGLESETIMLSLESTDYLLAEKIYVLQGLNRDINGVISLPEFLCWACSVCNNENAQFETINIPNSLELAWTIEEVKRIALLTGQVFNPTPELKDVVAYFLVLEGFSKPVYPFTFVDPGKLTPGQSEEDMVMKEQAIKAYIKFMSGRTNA